MSKVEKQLPQVVRPLMVMFPDLKQESDAEYMYPFYSLWAVGMPMPGPDFIKEAILRSGEQPYRGFIRGLPPTERTAFVEWLEAIYRAALYQHPFQLDVEIKNHSQPGRACFVPGGPWSEIAGGPTQSKIMVIGKHPGLDEANTGTNFSGSTSQVFIRALEELGIDEEEYANWYMTNIIKFPHLDAKHSQSLPATWIKDCAPILQQELRLVRPDFILCLGDDATKAMLGRQANLTNSAGQVFDIPIPLHEFESEAPILHIAKLMTCSHPARISRSPDLYPQFLGAIKLFIELTKGEEVGTEEKDLERYEIYTEEELKAWVNLVLAEGATLFAVDCEWDGSYPTDVGAYLRTIQIAWGHKKAATIVVCNEGGAPFQGEILPHLTRLLKNTPNRKVRIAGHNFRADLPWLIHLGLDLRPEFDVPDDDPEPNGVTRLYGWQKTATEGGIDTLLGVHAWQETHSLGLEACSSQLLGAPRYDLILEEWKTNYCRQMKILKSELTGYGKCPDAILHPYGAYDADVTWRLAWELIKPGGMLDCDRYGNNCRKPFWIAMRASPAFLEMEMTGVNIDRKRAEELTTIYMDVKERKLEELRNSLNWPSFNPASSRHRAEMLFGEKYLPRKVRLRPPGAKSLYLEPVKSTGKRASLWSDIKAKNWNDPKALERYNPSTDKESLGILCGQDNVDPRVQMLRDLSFISQLLRTVLRPPRTVKETVNDMQTIADPLGEFKIPVPAMPSDAEDIEDIDEAGDKIFDKGIISDIHDDGRVRPHFSQTAETGRVRCSGPNLQNWSKRREPDYVRIAGDSYRYPLRSIITASPGCVLLEADYSAAEVAGVGWMSGDEALIEHARRSALPDDHPDFFDIHANVAVRAFKLDCAPTKKGLKSIGKLALRTGAKSVFFGYLYGQGAEGSARKAREEGAQVSVAEAKTLIAGLTSSYPMLADYFAGCRSRVMDPGWMMNCFGRYRRFNPSTDRQVRGESERQAMNFPIQSLVADAMSRALDYLYKYRYSHPEVNYKILLQIHDAVILDVPIVHLEEVYDTVLPYTMSDMVDVWPTFLDGTRKPNITKPYHLGIGRDVYLHWGDPIPRAASKVLGIPDRFCDPEGKEEDLRDLAYVNGWKDSKWRAKLLRL